MIAVLTVVLGSPLRMAPRLLLTPRGREAYEELRKARALKGAPHGGEGGGWQSRQQPGAGQRGGQQSQAKERLFLTLNSPDLFSCPAPDPSTPGHTSQCCRSV